MKLTVSDHDKNILHEFEFNGTLQQWAHLYQSQVQYVGMTEVCAVLSALVIYVVCGLCV